MSVATSKKSFREAAVCCLSLVCGLALAGCSSTRPDRPTAVGPRRPAGVEFLLSPLSVGVPGMPAADQGLIASGFDSLRSGDTVAAHEASQAVLRHDPESPAARLLEAQRRFVLGDVAGSRRDLQSLVIGWPDYQAALLLAARSAELENDVVSAFSIYRRLNTLAVARDRSQGLTESARGSLRFRIEENVARGLLDAAKEDLDLLVEWGPGELGTWESVLLVAGAEGRSDLELESLNQLSRVRRLSRPEALRQASLELVVGRVNRGVELLETLAADHPHDPGVLDALAEGRFRFRLSLLPTEVSQLVLSESISRGDFATLLYWLLPGVRTARPESARIASDLPIDHRQRDAIVRVLNLDLMNFADPAVRNFSPEARLTQREAFRVLLSLPEWLGHPASCTGRVSLDHRWVPDAEVCRAAVACRLLAIAEQCAPDSPLTGVLAGESFRRTLDLAQLVGGVVARQ